MENPHPGYRARNLDVTEALRLNHNLCAAYERVRGRKDAPVWLLEALAEATRVSNHLVGPLIRHRDELPEYLP